MSDKDLDDQVHSISHQFSLCGHKMMQGHLKDRDIIVQQVRARESLRRRDPEGVALCQSLRIRRRQYSTPCPLEL